MFVRAACFQCAVIGLLLGGCQTPWHPWQSLGFWLAANTPNADADAEAEAHAEDDAPDASAPIAPTTEPEKTAAALPTPGLSDDRWVMNVRPMVPGKQEPDWRWRHPGLDATLALPESRRPALMPCLTNPNPVVAANSAILLGRWGSEESVDSLVDAAQNVNLKLPLRQAAIETLGSLNSADATRAVDSLLGNSDAQLNDPVSLIAIPELYGELLAARARHVAPVQDDRYVAAMRSRSALVRQEAAAAFARSPAPSGPAMPAALVDLCDDTDTRVRVAAITAIAMHGPPNAAEVLSRATRDYDLNVRIAAISALGELGTDEARQALDKLRSDPSEIARAAAIGALAAVGADAAMFAAATDRSPRVRQAVAESLKQWKSDAKSLRRETEALAETLVQDASTEVQRRAVESLREWPLDRAGPALLLAIEKGGFITRKLAAEQLAERWPPAENFSANANAERRAEQLAELRTQWQRQFGRLDEQVVRAVATEAIGATGLTEEQLAQLNELLTRFALTDPRQRRAAAAELAAQLKGQRLPKLVLDRLAALAENETDPIIWQSLMAVVADDPRDAATRLAYIAVANASSDVRRRACEYLENHPDRKHLDVLLPMLDDGDLTVAIAAVQAIGAAGIQDPEPLVRLLNARDRQLRLESAIVLAQSEFEAGLAAIERLSHETDLEIRRAATVAMGTIGDEVFLPRLIELIDDRRDIQIAALASLATIAGQDVAHQEGAELLPDEQVRRWKRWYAERTSSQP